MEPPIRREPRPRSVTGRSRCDGSVRSDSFASRHLMPEPVELPGVDLVPGGLEPLLREARQREVHVVAAEQDVLADRDALEGEIAVALGDGDQAEVGGAAADVADEDQVADRDATAPGVAEAVDPRIESSLRFLEQSHLRRARPRRRPASVSSRASSSNEAGTVSSTSWL